MTERDLPAFRFPHVDRRRAPDETGPPDDLLARLRGQETLRISSSSHGAVAALWVQANELGMVEIIDATLARTRRRVSGRDIAAVRPFQRPVKNDGLTVGQSLTLATLGRACHATSKRGFAAWASTTTLGALVDVDVRRLTSQHFRDQMDQVPVESIDPIERAIVERVLQRFDLPVDTLLFDAINRDILGRIVLMTDRDEWSTAEIIDAYHGQSKIEAVFAHLKDPMHLAMRPQYHWTDQKLHVHMLTCVLGYLLAQCVFLHAQRAGAPYASVEALLDALDRVRRATVARSVNDKGGLRVTTQLEEIDPQLGPILTALGVESLSATSTQVA